MHHRGTLCSHSRTTVAVGVLVIALFSSVESTRAGGSDLAQPLCATLRSVLPKVGTYPHPGARGLLIAAISEAFEHDPERLMLVQDQIDVVTSASCPHERDGMLGVLKMKTLAQAVR